jgi:cytochrome o ubiquinol oxidase subunit 1
MLWALAFMVTFVIGGMTGVLLAVPPADFVLHNSLFLVAHFHNVVIGGVLFGAFAGYTYWFPKAFGFKLDERLGKAAFWFWVVGFYVAFMPLYVLGLEGMTRRMQHYDVPEWHPWLIVAACGAALILAGIGFQIAQLVMSIRNRESLRDRTGDPWDGRTLEWSTSSPPPPFNFAVMPNVTGEEAYWGIKQKALEQHRLADPPHYKSIEMPRNSATGFVVAFFAVLTGFALIWHMWWMVAVGLAGAFATFVVFAWRDHSEYELSADQLATIDGERRQARLALAEGREQGITPVKYSGPPSHDPHKLGARAEPDGGDKGPAPKRIITGYGFWIFLLSDFVMFSGFYAAYAVLSHATAGGPIPEKLFDLKTVALETAFLLLSSFACGMASLATGARNMLWTEIGYIITGALGLGFLVLELSEFGRMLAAGAGPTRSAFLSAFFALVGLHGLHVTIGLLWLGTMMAQFWAKGFRADIIRRGLCFALFWHALDIIWVGIFTNVYLLGTSP